MFQDHSYSTSTGKLKRKFLQATDQLEVLSKKLKNTARREKRAKGTRTNLCAELYEKNLINAELRAKLESFGGK